MRSRRSTRGWSPRSAPRLRRRSAGSRSSTCRGARLVTASEGADLLVVGARGSGGFLGLRLGSVSEKCLQRATCPVAVIHQHEDPEPAAERIVVGVDGSDVSALALSWALDEARLRAATISAVSAWDGGAIAASAMPGALVDPQFLEEAAKETLDAAIDAADTSGLASPVERLVEAGGAPGTILRARRRTHHSSSWARTAGPA